MTFQEPRPIVRADLEEIAFWWGIPLDDLWPALEAERADASDDWELDEAV